MENHGSAHGTRAVLKFRAETLEHFLDLREHARLTLVSCQFFDMSASRLLMLLSDLMKINVYMNPFDAIGGKAFAILIRNYRTIA